MAPIVPARRGPYVRLDMGQKFQICQFMSENPKEAFGRVAEIFSERFQKKINKMGVCRIYRDRNNIQRCASHSATGKKTKSEDVIKFEEIFYSKFNQQLAKHGPQCFEQAQIKCRQIQKQAGFKDSEEVQKLKFGRKWWDNFQAARGMRWKRICSNRKTFTNNEVEKERKRLRKIMAPYQLHQTWNFDESSFFPEYAGSYSVHTPDVTNIPTGNVKRRLTMASFISADGEMIHPTFLDVHVNQYINKMHQTQRELHGVHVDGQGRKKKFKRRSFSKFQMYFTESGWVNSKGFKKISFFVFQLRCLSVAQGTKKATYKKYIF